MEEVKDKEEGKEVAKVEEQYVNNVKFRKRLYVVKHGAQKAGPCALLNGKEEKELSSL